MSPDVRCDLARFGQLDHVNWRRVSAFLARPAFQRRLQFPDRRIARTPDRIERQARAGIAAVAFDFEPAVSAIETLPDGRRRLRWPAIAFHLDRPRFRGAVRSADGFRGLSPAPSARIFAPLIREPNITCRDLVLMAEITAAFARPGDATSV